MKFKKTGVIHNARPEWRVLHDNGSSVGHVRYCTTAKEYGFEGVLGPKMSPHQLLQVVFLLGDLNVREKSGLMTESPAEPAKGG